MSSKYLLWDFDNTLAYRKGMWGQTIFDLLQQYGYQDIKLEDIRPFLAQGFPWHCPELSHQEFFKGIPWWDYMTLNFSNIIREIGVNDDLSDEISRKIKSEYLDISKWCLYDDTISCLDKAIKNGYQNIIVSNHVPELEDLVSNLGIREYFIRIYSSGNLGYEKPNIQAYKKVLDGIENTHYVTMIGDNYNVDIQGAINAGINAILVRKENVNNYKHYCKSLDEIFDFLG